MEYVNAHYNQNNLTENLKFYNKAFSLSVTENDPRIMTPATIKIPLRPHQAALVSRMYTLEKSLREGHPLNETEKFFSRFAILGDAVGSGKSLVILSYIAYMKEHGPASIYNPPYYHPLSTPTTFSFVEVPSGNTQNNLLIVPHTLYRQWMDYCKKQTDLKIFFCKTKKNLANSVEAKNTIMEADLTIVSNTLYTELQTFSEEQGIAWEHCFIDEVDTMYIPSTRPAIQAKFTWFISATWYSILKYNLYIPSFIIHEYLNSPHANHRLHPDFRTVLQKCSDRNKPFTGILESWKFFRQYTATAHPYRCCAVVRTTDDFRVKSIDAPPILYETIRCKANKYVRILSKVVTPEIQMALHAGDMDTVISELGIQTESATNLINGVTTMHNKELHRLEHTLEFKRGLDYASPAAKEAALKALEEKIAHVNDQIASLRKRIQDNNLCYICYEDLTGKEMVVPCCHNVFCATCILMSLTHRPNCPFCRTNINAAELCYIGNEGNKKYKEPVVEDKLTKTEQLLKLVMENPDGKFIVFSRFEKPFVSIQSKLDENNIRVEIVNGNKDQVFNTQERFRNGESRILLLNSQYFCAGMNLESATHIVLFHAGMTYSEEEQIIGRAYRMGRTGPLRVVRLLHEDE